MSVLQTEKQYAIRCHDAGSAWCLCVSGQQGYCPVCPVIGGDGSCDFCLWSGVCVYDQRFRHRGPVRARTFLNTPVLRREVIGHDLHLVRLMTPQSWDAELQRPGSFVMVRRPEDDEVFACPMAVCSADLDEQEFTIVFQVRGPKTAFLAGEGDQLAVKGPYRAGLFGVRRLYGAA
ncbi:MAG: hypothetical protein R6U70_07940, partial [Bacillota bacterium]